MLYDVLLSNLYCTSGVGIALNHIYNCGYHFEFETLLSTFRNFYEYFFEKRYRSESLRRTPLAFDPSCIVPITTAGAVFQYAVISERSYTKN